MYCIIVFGHPLQRIRIPRSWSQDLPNNLKFWVIDNLLLDHVGLPDILAIAVHLVNLFGWINKGDYSKTFLLEHSLIIEIYGWGGGFGFGDWGLATRA